MKTEQDRQVILIVDDTPENLDVLKGILTPDYMVKAATSGALALKIAQTRPDLVLLDIMMPEVDGYEVCRSLKSDPVTADIPVIFVTAVSDAKDEEKGLALGAVDYLTKPVHPAIVKARVRNHLILANQHHAANEMVRQRTLELQKSQHAAVYMLGEAGHYNDTDTGVHIWRMASYAAALARSAGWTIEQAELLELAAPMHDMGKIGISDSILKAPRKLTEIEMKTMQQHTVIGYQILSKSDTPLFKLAAEVALYHHEKWDGNGYPHRLKGHNIPESARIVAISDVFDALTMKRPYKEAWPIEKVFATLIKDAGTHFDPDLVKLFIEIRDEIQLIKQEWDSKEVTGTLTDDSGLSMAL